MPARSPKEVDDLFAQAMNAGDLEGALALFEDEGSFATQQGEVVSGKDALREALGGFFAMQPQLDLQIKKVILAGDIAVNSGAWTLKATGP
ncbi:MAG TPA: nuclear transport factor 2 family protein, partial [Dehalococcoidia bacterium]|nr:nuclear transport factor 2 family protein [Dehalococcoidia bacterium]